MNNWKKHFAVARAAFAKTTSSAIGDRPSAIPLSKPRRIRITAKDRARIKAALAKNAATRGAK